MPSLTVSALTLLLLAFGAADEGAPGQRAEPRKSPAQARTTPVPPAAGAPRGGASKGGASKGGAPNGKGAPSPALRDLRAEQTRRLNDVLAFERVKGSARAELERRRLDAALGGTEPEIVVFLLSEEAVHRDRVARLARLRELAVEARQASRVAAVDELARIERAQYLEVLRAGSRRLSPTVQRQLQALLGAGREPAVAREAKAAPTPKKKPRRAGQATAGGAPRAPRAGR